MTHECTQERFLRDVADHAITVIRDDGVSRHIRFAKPGSSNMYFDLITWPGCLCYTGDMGTYVFQRTTDMFEFFRSDSGRINLSYWTEKLIAIDGGRSGGKAKEFSDDKFRRVINDYRVRWIRCAKEGGTLDKDERRELWEAVDNEVLAYLEHGGERAMHAAYEFHHQKDHADRHGPSWSFDDLWDHDFTEYTFHMVWCCRALAWGIQQYDTAKKLAVEAVPA